MGRHCRGVCSGSVSFLNVSKISLKNMETKCLVTVHGIYTIPCFCDLVINILMGNKLRGACNPFCHQVQNVLH